MPMPPTTAPMIWLPAVFGIEDAARRHGIHDARDAEHAEFLVEPHFGKHRRMRIVRKSLFDCRIGHRSDLGLDRLVDLAQHLCERHRPRRIGPYPDLTFDEFDIGGLGALQRRILEPLRALEELLANAFTGLHDRRARRRRRP